MKGILRPNPYGAKCDEPALREGRALHLGAFVKVKDEFIAEPYPAWTAIGVSELLTDGALAEIRAIAKRG